MLYTEYLDELECSSTLLNLVGVGFKNRGIVLFFMACLTEDRIAVLALSHIGDANTDEDGAGLWHIQASAGDAARWERQARAGLDNIDRHFSPKAAEATVRRVFFD